MNKNILTKVDKLFPEDGLHSTLLDNVKLYKTTQYNPKEPIIYELCLILVLKGKKTGYLSNKQIQYDAKNYLVVPTILPFECETHASKEEPFLCMLISINKQTMYELVKKISKGESLKLKKNELTVFTDKIDDKIEDVVLRLVNILESKVECQILGEQILRELFYRIAMSENSTFLHKMFLDTNNEAKISKTIGEIHKNYGTHLDIPTLARLEDMSVSSYNTHFKKITSYTPLQYIKKIRLTKARDYLAIKKYQVKDTAYAVGYESISQFSKDFKNYFGYPPKDAKPYSGISNFEL